MSASDFWRTLSFALIPEPTSVTVFGTIDADYSINTSVVGLRIPSPHAPTSNSPIPAILMVNTPGDWNVHPFYKVPVTPANWGNATDLALVDSALANWGQRTRVVLIAEDDGTANGRCATALNWAVRHYDEVQEIALRAPIIDLVERHDRVGGAEATSIETAHGGTGTVATLPGDVDNYISTPHHADFAITADIDIRIELTVDAWTAGGFLQNIITKSVDGAISWRFRITAAGTLEFVWSTNGTGVTGATSTAAPSTVFDAGERGALRVTLDAVDGSNKTVTFYTSDSISGTWTQLGSAVTTAGNTSIFNSTSTPVQIGTSNNGDGDTFVFNFVGNIWKVEIRNGIDGTVVANPDFTTQTSGASSFADGTGKTWTMQGNAEIILQYLLTMSEWNPGANHRLHIMRNLFNESLHIWRDSSDSVTPSSVTDALAVTAGATLHTTLGTTTDVVPDKLEWPQQKAMEQTKKLHDYSRTSPDLSAFKTADGAQTVVLPDGRWVSLCSDTVIGHIDADDTFSASSSIIRNSILVHDGNGNVTGQIYSGAPGTPALLPDQDENPGSFYWPLGGAMESGLLCIMCDLRTGPGLGTPLDQHIVRLDPDTLAVSSIISLGDIGLRTGTIYPDPDTGFIYGMLVQPARMWRTPIGSLHDLAAYRYWDGATWNTDKSQLAVIQRNLPGGGTAPISSDIPASGESGGECYIRRWRGGWLAVSVTYLDPFLSIWYSDQPQGPWNLYRHLYLPHLGSSYYGFPLFGYFPFWHPERDDGLNKLMIGYSAITFGRNVSTDETDFIHLVPHFVIVEMHRDPFA
jgi:hypothetical protein